MTRTPEAGFGNTVYKTRRGAGAGARARWEGKKTAAFRRGGSFPDGRQHSFYRVISAPACAHLLKVFVTL